MSQRPQAAPAKNAVGPIYLNEMPTIRGVQGMYEFVNDVFGVPMRRTRCKTAIERRELPVYKISGTNMISERDAYLWVKSLAQPAVRRGGDAA